MSPFSASLRRRDTDAQIYPFIHTSAQTAVFPNVQTNGFKQPEPIIALKPTALPDPSALQVH